MPEKSLPRWLAWLLSFNPWLLFSYGSCGRCHISWYYVDMHDTMYIEYDNSNEAEGIGVLCEHCWQELTPEQRLEYYRKKVGDDPDFEMIEVAVLAGK